MGAADWDLRGEVVDGRYRVLSMLGSGGMGSVWQVRHVVTGQSFALKTIRLSDELPKGVAQHCLREGRAAATLRSRHAVRVFDVQPWYVHRDAPLPYLVMELLTGADFESLLSCGRALGIGEVAWVMGQVSAGIHAAHQQGVIHRDIKPANLILTTDDDGDPLVKICDFGLAKIFRRTAESDITSSSMAGALFGTPKYMAPEQFQDSVPITPSLDQWAIGLLVYRFLAGADYFAGATSHAQLVLRIVHDELIAPSRLSPSLSAAFDEWFLRSCARSPADRFATVGEQNSALLAALGHPLLTPVRLQESRPPGKAGDAQLAPSSKDHSSRVQAYSALNTGRWWIVVAALLSVCGTFGISTAIERYWQNQRPSRSPNPTPSLQPFRTDDVLTRPPPGEARLSIDSPPPSAPPSISVRSSRDLVPTRLSRNRAPNRQPNFTTAPTLDNAPEGALSAGAPCSRSMECHSRLCIARQCH